MATSRKPKKQCPNCGRSYGVPYFFQHMRQAHGVYGGRTGTTRQPKTGRKYPATEAELTAAKGLNKPASHNIAGFRNLDQFRVLEDSDGGIWLAERIR